jgi:hypothetical protein
MEVLTLKRNFVVVPLGTGFQSLRAHYYEQLFAAFDRILKKYTLLPAKSQARKNS